MYLNFGGVVGTFHPFDFQIDDEASQLIAATRQELTHKIATLSDGKSATWGFFPELEPVRTEYPACAALQMWFDVHFAALPAWKSCRLQLAFIRLAATEPQSAFGGLHIDASAGIDHTPPPNLPPQYNAILRILINLYDQPRQIAYAAQSIGELRARGADIPPDHYKIVELPASVPLKHYALPARRGRTLHGVAFDSRRTLHAGQTNHHGHFLLSYGSYVPASMLEKLFNSGWSDS